MKAVWSWLKDNWYYVVLFPVGLAVLIRYIVGSGKVKFLDPVARDDERAREQEKMLEKELDSERDKLDDRVQSIQNRTETNVDAERKRVEQEQNAVRGDSKRVAEYLNRVDHKNVDNH